MPTLSLIAAFSDNHVIGHANRLPWHLPADLKRFKQLTLGKAIIMGRKTFESIGKALPNRTNIIVTRKKDYAIDGATIAHHLEAAYDLAEKYKPNHEIMVIGGATLYQQSLAQASKFYLTQVHCHCQGDVYFPKWNLSEWKTKAYQTYPPDHNHAFPYTFITLEKVLSSKNHR